MEVCHWDSPNGTYKFGELGGPHKVNTCILKHLSPRHVEKGRLLCMVRHGSLSTQMCLVVSNGCDDELLGDIVVVPGVWTTFMFSELLCLDDSCFRIVFFDGFLSPLCMNIAPMSSEVFVWLMAWWTHWFVESVTIPSELICSTCLFLLCLMVSCSDKNSCVVGIASSSPPKKKQFTLSLMRTIFRCKWFVTTIIQSTYLTTEVRYVAANHPRYFAISICEVQPRRCHAPNTFGTVNMEHTIDLSLSWSKQWVWPM